MERSKVKYVEIKGEKNTICKTGKPKTKKKNMKIL